MLKLCFVLVCPALFIASACSARVGAHERVAMAQTSVSIPAQEDSAADDASMRTVTVRMTAQMNDVASSLQQMRLWLAAENRAGRIVSEETQAGYAALTIRLAPKYLATFSAWLGDQGEVLNRVVETLDVTREYRDSTIELRNQEVALERYRALLGRTTSVSEILQIEKELARVRTEIEKLKGAQRYLRDRVAQAVIHLTLSQINETTFSPEAGFHPGVRGSAVWLGGAKQAQGFYAAVGGSVYFSRHLQLDLDFLRAQPPRDAANAAQSKRLAATGLLLTLGGDTYSDYFGGGRRTTLNPYFGLRLGGLLLDQRYRFVLSATAGIELLRLERMVIDVNVRPHFLVGAGSSVYGLQLGLSVHTAF